ncbi:Thiol-disulfide oxidoreductase [Candidatus Sulfotelmatomonas gaucii]|uniref:Thiol-disulfide oxidoreductase n=1 Tax=Candidatus Sulfuritelmatomonas gaucii TaxID=2043161 RepID=A0A2N9LA42_9BACT|nr:Thiol-disulfide oxidoreductase [Candidatus Sulfotelmatomonas gaucii]
MRRNTVVLIAVLFILTVFAWAGWANWEYRRQESERLHADAARAELVPSATGTLQFHTPLMDKAAPAFALDDLSGKKVSLASYRGKALLINFWATWCGPCQVETPWLVELRNKYASQGFEVLGVDTEGDDLEPNDKAGWAKAETNASKFVTEMKVPYPVLLDGDSISREYGGLDDLPTSFFVDRNGKVVAAQVGLTSESDIEGNIEKALTQ